MSENDALRLEVTEFTDRDHWRWRLTDAAGKSLADHQVALDPAEAEYAGFLDLEAYLDQYAAPDKWPEDAVRLIEEVGAWIGERVLGPVATSIVDYGTPVTVRVLLPPEASGLLYRPLELAHAYGRPLSLHDVSLVFEMAGEAPRLRWRPVGDRLRMLAVFSLPTDVSALALRRERYQLKQQIHRIAQMYGLAIELRILQYGVTREALRDVFEEGEGWDLMHFSGHGLPACLVLEKADGRQDEVTSEELEELLHPARGRLKLVTLSSCLSAAATVEETLKWLGITPPTPTLPSPPKVEEPEETVPAVARALVRDLDCAVLAMRYPVGDDFAIALAAELYERLLGKRQRLARALQLALRSALRGGPHPGVPPLSIATPALFGQRAVGLALKPPRAAVPEFAPPPTGLAYFPPEPERFVGRVGPISRASAGLAPKSGKTGILFYGMAGAGKTACALELAYRYETGRFQGFVWHKAPDEGSDIEGALLNLALDMEKQLPGFAMAHLVDRADEFVAWLPRLTELLEKQNILMVLDNLESLLTPAGRWRDERWGHLVDALLAHHGLSRTVLTSRRRPADLNQGRVLVEPIHALSLSEAALLARELPNLGRLLRGESEVGLTKGRKLVARTLAVVQGHPKLIEFAEGQAGEPEALAAHLERAAAAWAGGEGRLRVFFQEGASPFEVEEFLAALTNWTQGVSAALPPASRTLFHFLCCLEEGDRQSWILEANWSDLWRRLELEGETPELAATLAPLTAAGLVEVRPVGENAFLYNLHPGVAEAGPKEVGDDFQAALDAELAAFWIQGSQFGLKEEMRGGGGLVAQAGRSAVPYLLRQGRWYEAGMLLERAIQRDRSPGTIAAVLPLLRHIASVTVGTEQELRAAGSLANALLQAGRWLEAEATMRDIVGRAVAREEFLQALANTGDLINILMATGRAEEALALVEEMKGYTRRAGQGPWTQLGNEVLRLQLLNALSRHEEVLAAGDELREQMRALPEESEQGEASLPWNVRETILDTAHIAAMGLEQWETMLALNTEIIASKEARGAPALEVARTRFNDYFPLLRRGCYGEARALLHACRAVYQEEGYMAGLGKVFSALADLEDTLGHHGQAVALAETGLRYDYLAGNPEECAIDHHNLSNYLQRAGREGKTYLAHRLAAGVVRFQTDSGMLASTLQNLAIDFGQFAPDPPPLPASLDELCRIVEAVEGARFRELFEGLPRRAASGDEVLREVVRLAQQIGATDE